MPRFVVHIGLPKTGTKYLQSNFRRLGEELRQNGVYYPNHWWVEDIDLNHDALLRDLADPRATYLDDVFQTLRESGHEVILLSCEGFSGMTQTERQRLKQLTGDNKVEIIFFCRRWSDWIPSAWQQHVKGGEAGTLPEFVVDTLSSMSVIPAINFEPILDGFEDDFGTGCIRVLSYSDLLDSKTDIAEVFFRDVLHMSGELGLRRESVHESVGVVGAEILRAINASERAAGRRPGIGTFKRLEKFDRHRDVAEALTFVMNAMKEDTAELLLDDLSGPFEHLFNHLSQKYRHALVGTHTGRIFEPRKAFSKYVRQDYLLRSGVADALCHVSHALARLDAAEAAGKDPRTVRIRATRRNGSPDILVAQGSEAVDYLQNHPAWQIPASKNSRIISSLDFGLGGTCQAAIGEGWHKAEDGFRWTSGGRSTLRVRRPENAQNYLALAAVSAFVHPEKLSKQRVMVKVNGTLVGSAELSEFSALEFEIPWTCIKQSQEILLEFELPDAAKPSDITGSHDARRLALCFRHLRIFADPVSGE